MKEKIKENLKTAYQEFLDGFSESASKEAIEERLGHKIEHLFENQKRTDWAKRNLKGDFNQAIRLFFDEFDPSQPISRERLENEVKKSEKVFLRHLDRSSMNYLKLILALSESMDDGTKGLLAEFAS